MASPKTRDYFITANEGAECYEDLLERVQNTNYGLYGYIVHDKDMLVEPDGTTKPKKVHKHVVIELKNPVSFQSMQNKFPGAHIETIKYKKSAYQYLIHSNRSAREKYQYPLENIVSNNMALVKSAIESETCELFKETEFLRYIAEGVRTPYQFVKRFGLNAYKQYWKPYDDMLVALDGDEEMQADLLKLQGRLADEQAHDLPFEGDTDND